MACKLGLGLSTSRIALTGIAAIGLTGCAGLSSPKDWFSRSSSSAPATSTLASGASGFTSQLKSMGSTVSSAMSKAKDVVTSPFTGKEVDGLDPETSLAHMPTSLSAELWVTQGQAAELKGNFPSALDLYTKALQQEPNNLPALQSTGRLYTRQEQHATAEEFYQRVVNVAPTAAHYAELADSQQKAGKLNEAQLSINKAIAMEPGVPRYRNNLAAMLVSVGRSDEAVRQLEQIFPPAVANYNVAYLHFTNKNMAAAQQHLNLALQADPNLKQARDLMATLTQSQTVQTAKAAYNVTENIYRTAQATLPPVTPAAQNSYMPQALQAPAQQASFPSVPGPALPEVPR